MGDTDRVVSAPPPPYPDGAGPTPIAPPYPDGAGPTPVAPPPKCVGTGIGRGGLAKLGNLKI